MSLRAPMGPAVLPIIGLIGTGISAVSTVNAAGNEADAVRQKSEYQTKVYESNANISQINAEGAISRGETAASRIRQTGESIIGSQRAAYAGQGVDVNTGTASQVQQETKTLSALDSLTARNNAWREAWGYKVEALNATRAGLFTKVAANKIADNTLATGGLDAFSKVAGGAYEYYKNTKV